MVISDDFLGEILLSPTSMLYRNLMAMETEEMVRAQPMDAVVMVGGYDKTLCGTDDGRGFAEVPSIVTWPGSMLTGDWRGERQVPAQLSALLGTSTVRAILMSVKSSKCASVCVPRRALPMVMGTASTMTCLARGFGPDDAGLSLASSHDRSTAESWSRDRATGRCLGRERAGLRVMF